MTVGSALLLADEEQPHCRNAPLTSAARSVVVRHTLALVDAFDGGGDDSLLVDIPSLLFMHCGEWSTCEDLHFRVGYDVPTLLRAAAASATAAPPAVVRFVGEFEGAAALTLEAPIDDGTGDGAQQRGWAVGGGGPFALKAVNSFAFKSVALTWDPMPARATLQNLTSKMDCIFESEPCDDDAQCFRLVGLARAPRNPHKQHFARASSGDIAVALEPAVGDDGGAGAPVVVARKAHAGDSAASMRQRWSTDRDGRVISCAPDAARLALTRNGGVAASRADAAKERFLRCVQSEYRLKDIARAKAVLAEGAAFAERAERARAAIDAALMEHGFEAVVHPSQPRLGVRAIERTRDETEGVAGGAAAAAAALAAAGVAGILGVPRHARAAALDAVLAALITAAEAGAIAWDDPAEDKGCHACVFLGAASATAEDAGAAVEQEAVRKRDVFQADPELQAARAVGYLQCGHHTLVKLLPHDTPDGRWPCAGAWLAEHERAGTLRFVSKL